MNKVLRSTLLTAAITLQLTGCKPEQSSPPDVPPPPPELNTAKEPPAQTPAPVPPEGLNEPISAESLSIRIEPVGQPTYVAASDAMRIKLRVVNNSSAGFLVSSGSKLVNLGVMLVGPEGPDKAPGVRDFIRIPLPMTPAGSTVEVSGDLPAKNLLGLPVRVELVQENVRWFENTGVDLGIYTRCKENETSLCDDKGIVLAIE